LTVRKNGKVIERWEDHNLIVDGARQLMAKMAAGIVSTSITDLGVGSGNAPETVDDTALKNGVLIPIKTRTVNDKQARFDFFIGTDQANGINIREFGLFTANGTMFAHRVRDRSLEKADDLTIEGYWEINF
jgi:hypothetical protein